MKKIDFSVLRRKSQKEIRGVKKRGEMITSVVRGLFASDPSTKAEFISLINLK